MAQAFLRILDKNIEVYVAGNKFFENIDESTIDENIITVMKEIGIDISNLQVSNEDDLSDLLFDYLISFSDGTKEKFTVENYKYNNKINLSFEEPAIINSDTNDYLDKYRILRDEIKNEISYFYRHLILPELSKNR